jgi:hypothetical protein
MVEVPKKIIKTNITTAIPTNLNSQSHLPNKICHTKEKKHRQNIIKMYEKNAFFQMHFYCDFGCIFSDGSVSEFLIKNLSTP